MSPPAPLLAPPQSAILSPPPRTRSLFIFRPFWMSTYTSKSHYSGQDVNCYTINSAIFICRIPYSGQRNEKHLKNRKFLSTEKEIFFS